MGLRWKTRSLAATLLGDVVPPTAGLAAAARESLVGDGGLDVDVSGWDGHPIYRCLGCNVAPAAPTALGRRDRWGE